MRIGVVTPGRLVSAPRSEAWCWLLSFSWQAPLLRCYLQYVYSNTGPGLVDKEREWVNPGWYVVHNVLVRGLAWPSEQVTVMLDRRRPAWHHQDDS